MKRMLAFATLLGALSITAALVSSTASAVATAKPSTPANIGGVVPVKGQQAPFAGIPLVYHGGPVMVTNKSYAIYWKPAGYNIAPGYDTTINQFFTDVAHDSGLSSNVYATDTQYYQNPGTTHIQYSSSFGGAYTDTTPFPASGCPLYSGLPVCLTDTQIQNEVDNAIAANGWTRNSTNMFFVFTPENVGSCFDDLTACAFTNYCAYHGTSNSGAIYANMPYTGGVGGCDEGQYPNGSSNQADPTINVTSHEHNEAITDPQLNAWYDSQGSEIGDKCAWMFGTLQGANGSEYNQTINGHHYYLQMEWSNSNPSNTCVQTYSIGGGSGPPSIASFSPTSGAHGITVTITGNNFTGATKVQLIHNFATYNASSFSIVSNTQIKATVPAMPRGLAKWRVTTPKGTATSSSYFNVTG